MLSLFFLVCCLSFSLFGCCCCCCWWLVGWLVGWSVCLFVFFLLVSFLICFLSWFLYFLVVAVVVVVVVVVVVLVVAVSAVNLCCFDCYCQRHLSEDVCLCRCASSSRESLVSNLAANNGCFLFVATVIFVCCHCYRFSWSCFRHRRGLQFVGFWLSLLVVLLRLVVFSFCAPLNAVVLLAVCFLFLCHLV